MQRGNSPRAKVSVKRV